MAALNENLSRLDLILKSTLSNNNSERKQAENALESFKNEVGAGAFLSYLIQTVKSSQEIPVQQSAAIMLFNNLKPMRNVWEACDPQSQLFVKQGLLEVLSLDLPKLVINSCVNAASRLRSRMKDWPELLELVFKLLQSPNSVQRSAGLVILGELAEYSMESISGHLNDVKKVLLSGFADPEAENEFRESFHTEVLSVLQAVMSDATQA
eukprot:557335_1